MLANRRAPARSRRRSRWPISRCPAQNRIGQRVVQRTGRRTSSTYDRGTAGRSVPHAAARAHPRAALLLGCARADRAARGSPVTRGERIRPRPPRTCRRRCCHHRTAASTSRSVPLSALPARASSRARAQPHPAASSIAQSIPSALGAAAPGSLTRRPVPSTRQESVMTSIVRSRRHPSASARRRAQLAPCAPSCSSSAASASISSRMLRCRERVGPLRRRRSEITASLLAGARSALRDVTAALQRMDDGSYGRCTSCGGDSPSSGSRSCRRWRCAWRCQRARPHGRPAAATRSAGPSQCRLHGGRTCTTAPARPWPTPTRTDAADQSRRARRARELAERTGVERHDVAIVLGSGWVPAIDALGTADAELPVTDLPGFLPPAVEGHAGRIRSLDVGGVRVLAFLGRTHLYEGRGVERGRARRAGRRRGRLPHRRPDQRLRRPAAGPRGRRSGADQRPPQPHLAHAAGRRRASST